MGNQIKFSPKNRDDSISDNDDYRTLEIKNIQLKNTNRKLISKIDQQKKLIKNLTHELESFKNNNQVKDCQKIKNNHQLLKEEHKKLEMIMDDSHKEISKLKKEIEDLKNDSNHSSPWDKLKKIKNLRDTKK